MIFRPHPGPWPAVLRPSVARLLTCLEPKPLQLPDEVTARWECCCVGSRGVSAAREILWASWAEVPGRGDPDSDTWHLQPTRAGPPSGARTSLGDTHLARHIRPMHVPLRLRGPGRVAPRLPCEIRANLEMGLWRRCGSGGGTWSELPPDWTEFLGSCVFRLAYPQGHAAHHL